MSNLATVCTHTFSQWLCLVAWTSCCHSMFLAALCNVYSYYRRAHPNIKYRKNTTHTKSIWWNSSEQYFHPHSLYDISQSFFALSHSTDKQRVYYTICMYINGESNIPHCKHATILWTGNHHHHQRPTPPATILHQIYLLCLRFTYTLTQNEHKRKYKE